MDKNNTIRLIDEIKTGNINVKATIENAIKADFLGLKHAYVNPIVNENTFETSIPQEMGLEFEDYADYVDGAFYEKALECLENEGIYITLGYVSNFDVITTSNDKVITYISPDYDSSEFDWEDEMVDYEVLTASKRLIFRTYESEEIGCDIASDYGIKVKKINDSYDIEVGMRGGASCCGPDTFDTFVDNGDETGWEDINNPLNQVLVELMYDEIIFNK